MPEGIKLRVEFHYSQYTYLIDEFSEKNKNAIMHYAQYVFGYDTEVKFVEE